MILPNKGEITCLAGSNGAGKTTIVNIIADLIKPDTGEVRINQSENTTQISEHVRFHFDDLLLIEDFKVKEFFSFIAYLNGLESSISNYRSQKLMNLFDLEPLKRIADLSRGQKVKCSIATLLLKPVTYLVLDEPFVHLDFQARTILKTILLELKNRDKCLLITTHDVEIISSIADKLLHLRDDGINEILGDEFKIADGQNKLNEILNSGQSTVNPIEQLPWLF